MTVKLKARASNRAMMVCFLGTLNTNKQITINVKYIVNKEKASDKPVETKTANKLTNIDKKDNDLKIGFNLTSTKEKPNKRLVQMTTVFVKI